jgi:MFS family permease
MEDPDQTTEQSSLADQEEEEEEDTPVPWSRVSVLLLIVFVEAMFNSMLYPFIAFMVHDLFYWLPRDDPDADNIVSFYAGLVASCFSFAQLFGAFIWGSMSDKHGRRKILLIGMMGNVITCPLFGLAPTYALAVAARCLSGLINGNIGVAKAYASEISDDTNRAKIFSFLGLAWGVGVILGPVLGGICSHPYRRFPFLFSDDGLFYTYPYLLPLLINSFISLIGFTVGYFSIKETVVRH